MTQVLKTIKNRLEIAVILLPWLLLATAFILFGISFYNHEPTYFWLAIGVFIAAQITYFAWLRLI